jgi:hypothetical protein
MPAKLRSAKPKFTFEEVEFGFEIGLKSGARRRVILFCKVGEGCTEFPAGTRGCSCLNARASQFNASYGRSHFVVFGALVAFSLRGHV